MTDLYLMEDNGTVGYYDKDSLPDAQQVELAVAGDAAVAVFDGSGVGAPIRTTDLGDWDSHQEHIRRILQEEGKEGTVEEAMTYFRSRRDAMIERFSTPSNQRALKALADELLRQPIECIVPELQWRHLFGGRAEAILRKAMQEE